MPGRGAQRKFTRGVRVVGEYRAGETSLPILCQCNRFIEIGIRDHRTDRTECLDPVYRVVAAGAFAVQQHRRKKCAAFGVGVDDIETFERAEDYLSCRGEFVDTFAYLVALRK